MTKRRVARTAPACRRCSTERPRFLRVDITKDAYGYYDDTVYDDTVYVVDLASKRILEDDIVEFVGAGSGLKSYESTRGATVTIPSVVVGKYLVIH
ncbi:MAG: hypothetical protein ABI628_10585 [Chloroflexota bacterium]